MIEKGCETCKEVMKVFGDYSPCMACDDSCSNWQPSELYTSYLAERERAGMAEGVTRGLIAEIEKLKEKLTPGSMTERAPTTDAYDAACRALQKWRDKAEMLRVENERMQAVADAARGFIMTNSATDTVGYFYKLRDALAKLEGES